MVPVPVPHGCYRCRRRTGLIVGLGVLLWASSSADLRCIIDSTMESKRNSRASKAAANSDSDVSATTGAQKKKRGRPKKGTSKGGGKPPAGSASRTTRSTRASARTPSPKRSLRLRGDDPTATCVSRCHPSNLICVGCSRNEEQRSSASRSYKEHPCSRLWIESSCKSGPDHCTYSLVKEWEGGRTSVSVPT